MSRLDADDRQGVGLSAAGILDWLFECVEGANASGQGCGYPNLSVLFIPGALAFLFAYFSWNRKIRRGESGPYFTPLVRVLIWGSLALSGVAALIAVAMA